MNDSARNIFNAQYPTVAASDAVGVPADTLRTWQRRNLIIGHKGGMTGGGQHGVVRSFSFFNVIEIGLAKALLDCGLGDVSHAFAAAAHLAHYGVGAGKMHPRREPGCPFDRAGRTGETLLCVRGDQSEVVWHQVGADVLPVLYHRLGGDGFVILRADPVFERIVTALGYDHREVLNFAYGRGRS